MSHGSLIGLAALTVSVTAFGQVERKLDRLATDLYRVQGGMVWTGWPQVDNAVKLYGLDTDQAGRLRKWVTERMSGNWQPQTARWKLNAAIAGMKEAGVPFDEEIAKQKSASLQAEVAKYAGETRTLVRNEILTEEQRKAFDAQQAEGNDPLTGEPADDTLSNHDPAKFKSFNDARMKKWQDQAAAWQGSYRASQIFTGKGFIEAEWSAWLDRTATAAGMDDRQRGIAAEFLDMAKSAAADYRKAKEAEYKAIAADLAEIQKGRGGDPAKQLAVQKTAAELSAPVDEIGKRFRKDVTELLTEEQRKKIGTR